jgi:uncharacterized protein (TIGR00730 family)
MKRIAVFLSSSDSVSPLFQEEAEGLGRSLAEAGYGVVYGGSNAGCMGRLADGVIGAKGQLLGVVPEMDFVEGLVQPDLTEKILVGSISERKTRMIERADAFVAYPGGLGTLDEVSDVLALRQIGLHAKPLVFYNYLGFWTPFVECLETFYQQRMISTPLDRLFVVLDRPEVVIDYLNECFRN